MKRKQDIIRIVFQRILSVVVVIFTVSDGNALAQSNALNETGYGHDTTCKPVVFVKTNLLYDMMTFVNNHHAVVSNDRFDLVVFQA